MTSIARFRELTRKAVELGLREAGLSQEMRRARSLRSEAAPNDPDNARLVLFLTPRDWSAHVQWEALLAHALRQRGAEVRFLTCGGGLEVCDRVNTYEGPPVPCHTCAGYTRRALAAHGFVVHALSDHWRLDPDAGWPELDFLTMADLQVLEDDGLPYGELTDMPLQWFLCSSDLEHDPLATLTLRRFLRSARRIAAAVDDWLARLAPDVLVLMNGLFLFEAVAAVLAERRGVRVVSYERGFVHGSLVFCHGPDAPRWDIDELWEEARSVPLGLAEEARLDEYLADRRLGLRALFQYWPNPTFDTSDTASDHRRKVVLFTNLTWDTAVLHRELAYPSMQHWVVDTIRHLADRPDVSLIVRIHPAEARVKGWETREPAADAIERLVGEMPTNVRLVLPVDPLSSYALMDVADLGLVYSSTTGFEMALMGKPVVLAGRAHYGRKGFTFEAESQEAYRALLDEVIASPDRFRPDVEAARRYAHLSFFDTAFEQPPVAEPIPGLTRLTIREARQLAPGSNDDLDIVCDGILHGMAFSHRFRDHPGADRNSS